MDCVIKKATYLSDLAYQHPSDIEAELKTEFENFKFVENKDTDTQVICCQDETQVYQIFRGTTFDNIEDWYTNLDIRLKPLPDAYGNILAHAGFSNDVFSVLKPLIQYAYDSPQQKKIAVGGHSQGGGDCPIYGLMLSRNQRLSHVIPVAGPRVFGTESAVMVGQLIGDITHRIVNNNDIVPRVPPRSMGYRHIFGSHFHYFKETGEYVNNITEWELLKDRIHGRLNDLFEMWTDGIKDHYPGLDGYVGLVNSVNIKC